MTPIALKMRLIDYLRTKFTVALSPGHIEFGDPAPALDPQRPWYNTQVTVEPLGGSPYSGPRTIYYQRQDIVPVLTAAPIAFETVGLTLLSELIPLINAQYGLDLTSDDYYDTPLPPPTPEAPYASRKVTVAIKPTSYFYLGTLDLELNPEVFTAPAEGPYAFEYYAYLEGYPAAQSPNALIAVDSTGTPKSQFEFLSNASNITAFTVEEMIPTGDTIVLNGEFNLEAVLSDTLVPVVAKSLTLDFDGRILDYSAAPRFRRSPTAAATPLIFGEDHIYTVDPEAATPAQSVLRWTLAGVLDAGYSVEIDYIPAFIRLSPTGKLYTVSGVYTGPDVYNNNVATPQQRIDRWLPTGARDNTFLPVYVKNSVLGATPDPVVDLAPNDPLGVYFLVNPGPQPMVGRGVPVLNNVPVVSVNSQHLATVGWNPVGRFMSDGQYDLAFNQSLLGAPDALYDAVQGTLTVGGRYLYADANGVQFLTYRANPITLMLHHQVIQFTPTGQQVYVSGKDYVESYEWVSLRGTQNQVNGDLLAWGEYFPVPVGAMPSVQPREIIALYRPDGGPKQLLWLVTQPSQFTLTVKTAFVRTLVLPT
jgi:hypothetical protein